MAKCKYCCGKGKNRHRLAEWSDFEWSTCPDCRGKGYIGKSPAEEARDKVIGETIESAVELIMGCRCNDRFFTRDIASDLVRSLTPPGEEK